MPKYFPVGWGFPGCLCELLAALLCLPVKKKMLSPPLIWRRCFVPHHDQVRNMLCRLTLHLAAPQVAHRDLDGVFVSLGVQLVANRLVLEQVKCCSDPLCLLPAAHFPPHLLLCLSKCSKSVLCALCLGCCSGLLSQSTEHPLPFCRSFNFTLPNAIAR